MSRITPQNSEFYEKIPSDDSNFEQQSDPQELTRENVPTETHQIKIEVNNNVNPAMENTPGSDLGRIAEAFSDINDFVDTSDRLDDSYNKLICEMQSKLNLLGSKCDEAEVENPESGFSQQASSVKTTEDSKSVKKVVEARQQELVELLDQQILDLASFEDDVQGISSKFPKDSEDSEVKALQEKISTLQINITKKMGELRHYKEEIREEFSDKTLEESIVFINNLNDKLTKSVEQMTKEINRVQYEVSNFNFMASRREN